MGRLGAWLLERGIPNVNSARVKLLTLGKLSLIYWNDAKLAATQMGSLYYRCNICGHVNETQMRDLDRETVSCLGCGSNVRHRAIIDLLSNELFGTSLALPDFPVRPDIKGVGLTDCASYANLLAKKLGYQNTYYHKEPRLDITDPEPALRGTLDFVIAGDVLEHVAPPAAKGFEGAYALLKPGGVLILTVPYSKQAETVEHFPDLHKYRVSKEGNGYVLENTTREGQVQVFKDLVFHSSPGVALEMRVFAESSLRREFVQAGFRQVNIVKEPCWEYGIYWSSDVSLPMVARK